MTQVSSSSQEKGLGTRSSLVPPSSIASKPRRASAAICAKSRSHEDPDGDKLWINSPLASLKQALSPESSDFRLGRCRPSTEAEPRDPRPRTPKRDIHFQFHISKRNGRRYALDARRSLCKLRNMLHGALPRPTPLSLCPTRYTRRAARHPDRRWPPRDPPLRNASTLER